MTTYAIGSVNGDYQALTTLLDKIAFNPDIDCLWFSGNLVGGPESLAVLRLVKDLGKKAVTVLGDAELYLLQRAAGVAEPNANDTLDDILNASDRDELLKWLRQRGLIHHDSKRKFTLVHAGIPGAWSFSQALTFACEVESALASNKYPAFMENRRQDQTRWHAKLTGWKRLNFIANAYTLMKYCNEQGKLDFLASGAMQNQVEGLMPWYRQPERGTAHLHILFADDAGFADQPCPGIYPLPAVDKLRVLTVGD